jgi:hypothetical protein
MKCKFERKHQPKRTYNPQKIPGKSWKVKWHNLKNIGIYSQQRLPTHENTTGDRHP